MKHIVWKVYMDYEKEEKWLNEMSAKGMALTGYSWCRYVFEETSNNQYIYRIELLKNMPAHPESIAYIRFLEESGVECVASYMRWVYLRKKAIEGSFDIYTDIDSKIKHYKRIQTLWNTLMFAELTAGLSNLLIGIVNLNIGEKSTLNPVRFFHAEKLKVFILDDCLNCLEDDHQSVDSTSCSIINLLSGKLLQAQL